MEHIKRLMEKRALLMDKYTIFIKKTKLTEKEREEKKKINREIIYLDFEIEEVKDEEKIS